MKTIIEQQQQQLQTIAAIWAGMKGPKPKFYEGKRDVVAVDQWLYQVQQYLNVHVAPANQHVQLAAMYLKGPALLWWLQRDAMVTRGETAPFTSLRNFADHLRAQFVPIQSAPAARQAGPTHPKTICGQLCR